MYLKVLSKLILGNVPQGEKRSHHVLGAHLKRIRRVWHSEDYEDFGIERIFRLFLIGIKLLCVELYFEHFFSLISIASMKIMSEIYIFLKTVFPFFVLYSGLSNHTVFLVCTIYFLVETFIFIFNRIYVSEQFSSEGYRRSLLLIFLNFIQVVLSFAVIYSSGKYLNHSFIDYTDAVYFSMMTASTIGYGDIHPANSMGKIIAMAQALTSLAFLVLFFNFFNSKIED